jgi:DNA ligase-1
VWSRGEDLITERFPEVEAVARGLPEGTVVDGEILPWDEATDAPLPFTKLQRRITRTSLTREVLRKTPVILVAYDLIEDGGADIRGLPLSERRARLEERLAPLLGRERVRCSPIVSAPSWEALAVLRAESRARGAEGLMLKRLDSPYRTGRVRGDWWKWKVEPYTVDAVLTAAQRGSGKRASLYTDYTFSVWRDGELVPFTKAYSGLTDEEIRRVDGWIRQHMREKFGPVRTVEPVLVFELGFEAIQRSTRHKAGLAVRFPRILRWRHDKPAEEADSIASIEAMLEGSRPEAAMPDKPALRQGSLFGDEEES